MTREQYVEWRLNNGVLYILWNYYTSNCKEPLVKSVKDFANSMNMYSRFSGFSPDIILGYYDNEFNLTLVEKDNKIIRII